MTSQISLDEFECIKTGKRMYQKSVPIPLEDLIIFRKKPGRHKKTLLVLISNVDANYNQSQLADKLEVSRTTIKRYTQELEEKDLISYKRIGHNNFYKLTFRGQKLLELMYQKIAPYDTYHKATIYKTIRSHEIRWKIPIIRMPYNKNAFEIDLLHSGKIRGKIPKDKLGWVQYRGYLGSKEDHLGWWYFTPNNLVVTIREVFCEDPYDAIDKTLHLIEELTHDFEEYPPYYGLRLGTVNYIGKLIHRHHAIPDDEFAKLCVAHHINIKTDRIIIDASHSPELETHGIAAEDDILKYRDFVGEVIETTPQFSPSLINKSIENMGNLDIKIEEFEKKVENATAILLNATEKSLESMTALHQEHGYMFAGGINFQQKVREEVKKQQEGSDKVFLIIERIIKRLEKPTFKNIYRVLKKDMDFVELTNLLRHYVSTGDLIYKNGVYRVKDS